MNNPPIDYTDQVRAILKDIAESHTLRFEESDCDQVEFSGKFPIQSGLDFDIHVSYQNGDELWIDLNNFRVCYFPCSKPEIFDFFKQILEKLIMGQARIAHFKIKGWEFKSVLQVFENGDWADWAKSSNALFVPFLAVFWKSAITQEFVLNKAFIQRG